MFCQKCGKEIHNEAVVCIHCGCAVTGADNSIKNGNSTETNGLAITALILSFFVPIAGLILGIVGLVKYKNQDYKSMSVSAIIISVLFWVVSAIILVPVAEYLF